MTKVLETRWALRALGLAREIAGWSKDPSSQVGAIIFRPDKTIAALGYNGFARGVADTPGRLSDRDVKLALMIHAEQNAILNCRDNNLMGYALAVWPLPPCAHCASLIIQAGIRQVIAPNDIPPARWLDNMHLAETILTEAGVTITKLPTGG